MKTGLGRPAILLRLLQKIRSHKTNSVPVYLICNSQKSIKRRFLVVYAGIQLIKRQQIKD